MTENKASRIGRTFRETFTSAAVWFPLGNTFLAWQNAEISGIALMAATTAFTTIAKARASWTQSSSKTHFYILSTVNAALAASVLYNGIDQNGFQQMLSFATEEVRQSWFAAAAFAGWSYCHSINGQLDKIRAELKAANTAEEYSENKKENRRNIMNVFASASAVNFDLRQMPILGLSLLRSVFSRESDNNFDGTVWSYLKKHVTSSRIMSAKYATGVVLVAAAEPLSAASQACWAIGQYMMDPERNADLKRDTKNAIFGNHESQNLHP